MTNSKRIQQLAIASSKCQALQMVLKSINLVSVSSMTSGIPSAAYQALADGSIEDLSIRSDAELLAARLNNLAAEIKAADRELAQMIEMLDERASDLISDDAEGSK